ncbi:MAG: formate--tetrahydrofolate ligase [Prevotella sp.]|nr:formate--tetrahydrofolate ligase [Prevotella sp.]
MTDIEIARQTPLAPISQIAEKLGIPSEAMEHYGRYIAKVDEHLIDEDQMRQHRLILVTSISPTKAGIGKTTVSIGLALGLCRMGLGATVALREPSLGPCFGIKGGAAGGGHAQVLPMEKINLHFTGDFHAVTSAHNMIAALLDNYLYQHRAEGPVLSEIYWKRVLDVNDRALRNVTIGQLGEGIERATGFDITPASELMAILCLATSLDDLRRRIGNILLGITTDGRPFTVADLGVTGAITALLLDAIRPNLVQTTEQTPALVHGGPFANIAHGCSTVLATRLALTLSPYVVTEAGFGADLGAEKFFDIKCRKAHLQPALTVLVATTQGLKMHGGVDITQIRTPQPEGLVAGFRNMDRHIRNLQRFGQTVVVAINRYADDTDEELQLISRHCDELGVGSAINNAYAEGGEGALPLARLVADTISRQPSQPLRFTYDDDDPILTKIEKVARNIYGATSVTLSPEAQQQLADINSRFGAQSAVSRYPVCIAKTQYSFTADARRYGCPEDFDLPIRQLIVNAGAEMIVAVAGKMMRMPGLPLHPQAECIDVADGQIVGLS